MKNKGISRRRFLKGLGAIGGVAVVAPAFVGPVKQTINGVWGDLPHGVGAATQDYTAEDVIFTTCEQCNTHCTIKTHIVSGGEGGPYTSLIRKISGNQYSPITTVPYGPISYETPMDEGVKGLGDVARDSHGLRGGRTCLKGQAGIQIAYDTYRVKKPLKRVGKRGSGEWKTISWEEAYQAIIEGDPELGTPGLKEIWAYVPEKPVMDDWTKVKVGEMSFEAFDLKYKDLLIDTKHPDFGPKSNQIGIMAGDRRDFIERFLNSMGTANYFHHGGICGMSSVMGNQRSYEGKKKKKRQYVDLDHIQFMIVWGTNPLVANKGPTWLAPQITNALQRGMKMAVIEPRMSKTAEKADHWVPIKPGTDGALALAMGRWIVENQRYDLTYLLNPNKAAAELDGEPTWSDATFLVDVSKPNRPKLRASDLGIGTDKQYVVLENGQPVPHDLAQEGTLEVDTIIGEIHVKSAFTLYKERVMEKTLEEYADITGIDVETIIRLAEEFTSHGKRAATMVYRGPAMHGNGYYASRAIAILNHLLGNYDWKGGNITTGAFYKEVEGRYDLLSVPNANTGWGLNVARYLSKYEKSTLFERDGYPARRPWFQFGAHTVYEVLPSIAEGYPYGLKALFIHRMSPVLSSPLGRNQAKYLADPAILPLVVASDVQIGDTSQYADFILPDTTYLERWGWEAIYPNIKTKFASVFQPVTRVYPDVLSFENVLIELGKRMKWPGVGEQAFPDGSPLHEELDYYLKRVANIAFDETPVPDASDQEVEIFIKARQKALGKYFVVERWQQAVKPEEWRKVLFVLNRGGRFEGSGDEYRGEHVKYGLYAQANFYDEGVAGGRNSYHGEFFDGIPRHEEIQYYNGDPVQAKYPLQFINWKSRNLGTTRTVSSAWLREVRADNYLWINPLDAQSRQLKTGDQVKVIADGHTALATILVTEGIRPGVVGSAYNMGQSGYGVNRPSIDGAQMKSLPTYGHIPFRTNQPMKEESGYAGGREAGFRINELLMPDPSFTDGTIVDLIGGAPGQLDLFVEITKA